MSAPSTIWSGIAGRHSRELLPGFAVVNSNYQYLSINETLASFHGRTVQDHIGRSVVDAIQPSVHRLLLPAYRKVITTGIPAEDIFVEALAGNRLKRCLVSYYPVKSGGDPLWSVQVVAVDMTSAASQSPDCVPECHFSPTQLKILRLIGDCKSNKEIAQLLNVSVSTVCTHRKAIICKTNLHRPTELVFYARKMFRNHPL